MRAPREPTSEEQSNSWIWEPPALWNTGACEFRACVVTARLKADGGAGNSDRTPRDLASLGSPCWKLLLHATPTPSEADLMMLDVALRWRLPWL